MDLPDNFKYILSKTSKLFRPGQGNFKAYHYTSLKNFEKILNSKELYLTYYDTLNDPTELKHGSDIFHKLRDKILNRHGLTNDYLKTHAHFLKEVEKDPKLEPFIISFSLKENLLGQWKGYANNGDGVCFEIDIGKLRNNNSLIGKVIYDTSIQTNIIKNILNMFGKKIKQDRNKQDVNARPYQLDLNISLLQGQLMSAILMKHSGWAEEQEVRYLTFVETRSKDVFEVGFKKRIKCSIKLDYITKVMWGPRVSLESIDAFKEKFPEYFNKTFNSKSTIPWR